jgi:cytoplasmic iron level regulating protein YaaA (DUF328/UPF0246 family)
VLLLLPPSEGKTQPATGPALDLTALCAPSLNPTRELLLRTLVRMSQGNAKRAAQRLGLGPNQLDDLERNAGLIDAPTARADSIYTGVLYDNWSPGTAASAARAHAGRTVLIASALFGVVRASDHIPAYRLSAGVALPRLGTVDARWRQPLGKALAELAGDGLLVDLRSGAYINLHKPAGDLAGRTVTLRVLTETDGVRKVVSHFNKATKGEIVRALCEHQVEVERPAELAEALADVGWTVELEGQRLDVVV